MYMLLLLPIYPITYISPSYKHKLTPSLNLQWINPPRQEFPLPYRYHILSLVLLRLNPKWMLGLTRGLLEPQSPTQIIEPNTESDIHTQSTSRPKLPVRRKRSDKVGTVREPTTLPPLKKRKTFLEATVSPSVSS